jgi:hypothetical protein
VTSGTYSRDVQYKTEPGGEAVTLGLHLGCTTDGCLACVMIHEVAVCAGQWTASGTCIAASANKNQPSKADE